MGETRHTAGDQHRSGHRGTGNRRPDQNAAASHADPPDDEPGARPDTSHDDAPGSYLALLHEVDRLRDEVRRTMSDLRAEVGDQVRRNLDDIYTHIAEMRPRLDDQAIALAKLAATTRQCVTDSAPAAANASTLDDLPVATPALRWDALSRAEAEQAWAALGEFTDRVLYRQYRLTRWQIPDCWALHPPMVRAIAWLRTAYLTAAVREPDDPSEGVVWHLRCLPGFLLTTDSIIDPRECRPGVHRLTEDQVARFTLEAQAAQREGRPAPLLTTETGPDRPHLRPEHYPARTTATAEPTLADPDSAGAPPQARLRSSIAGPCHPEHWRVDHRAATVADLTDRH